MRVLDIDLDFFLDRIAVSPGGASGRLSSDDYRPWPEEEVRRFVEERCGLQRSAPTPGVFVRHHRDAFYVWRDRISDGRLSVPFDLVHVDAHSDLGAEWSDARYFVATELLTWPVAQRAFPPEERVTIGNFLLFGLACRWFRTFTLVQHPKYVPEIPNELLVRSGDPVTGLQARRYTAEEFHESMRRPTPLECSQEPIVPFLYPRLHEFRTTDPFDLITVCQSPNFTPREADQLLPVLLEYVDLEHRDLDPENEDA